MCTIKSTDDITDTIFEKNIFKVYIIDKYTGKTKYFIDNNYDEYSLTELNKLLESNNSYHLRIQKNNSYIFFGDCDGYKDNNPITFFNLLISFLDEHYDIKITFDDISYTINKSKIGSYHYSIPKIYASINKLKEIHENFFLNIKIYSIIIVKNINYKKL